MFRCEFCGQVYQRELAFLNHTCEAMERAQIFSTATGQAAYGLYQKWWTLRKRIPPGADKFKESTQFRSFVAFAKFVKKTKISTDVYLNMVIKHQLSPEHWLRDDVYVKYLEYIDRTMTGQEQIKLCVEYILKLGEALDCDSSDVFLHLTSPEIMQLLRDRKLSPWILLHSKAFKVWLIQQDNETQLRLQDLIRPVYWKMRFSKEPDVVAYAKTVTKAMGI